MSLHGSCTDPGRPPSVAQRCSAFLNGSMRVLVAFPWPRSVLVLLVWAALSQDICSLKLGYPAGSWEAWTFPEEWGEGRYPSLATSPIGWQKVIKQSKWEEAKSYQNLWCKTTEIIGSQRAWFGIFAQAVAIPEDHSVCPSISLVSLLDAHFLQG